MASGTPVVAPNCGGITSYANSDNAWTVRPDAMSFANAIEEAAFDLAGRECKTRSALATAQRHQWARIAADYLALYRNIAEASRGTQPEQPPAFVSQRGSGRQQHAMQTTANLARHMFLAASRLVRISN
jgi:hypothetical protein